jgi:hypothetical protein
MVLRTYAAPRNRGDDLAKSLQRVLIVGEERHGSVQQLDDGRLLVVAPTSVQDGVAELCHASETSPVPSAPATVELSYWVVLAEPAETADASALPRSLAPAMDEIVHRNGPHRFELLDTTRIASIPHAWAQSNGANAKFTQTTSLFEDELLADIAIDMHGAEFNTRVALRPGELAVIGQSTQRPSANPMFFIVQGQIRPSA